MGLPPPPICHYAANLHTVFKTIQQRRSRFKLTKFVVCVHECVLKLLKQILEGLVGCKTILPVPTQKLRLQRGKKSLLKGLQGITLINTLNQSKYNVKCGRRCQYVIDASCQKASEMLYETIAISLFSVAGASAAHRLGLRCSPLAPALFAFAPVRFHSKRETACRLLGHRLNFKARRALERDGEWQIYTRLCETVRVAFFSARLSLFEFLDCETEVKSQNGFPKVNAVRHSESFKKRDCKTH